MKKRSGFSALARGLGLHPVAVFLCLVAAVSAAQPVGVGRSETKVESSSPVAPAPASTIRTSSEPVKDSRPLGEATPTVTADGRQLNVGAGELVTLTTILTHPAKETIVLTDMKGSVVRTLVDEPRVQGTYRDSWDGTGDGGRHLRDDQYRWVATFCDESHSVTIDYSKDLDGDFELKSHPEYSQWDPFGGVPLRFSHKFERPGEIAMVFSRATYNVTPRCDPPAFFCRFLDGYQPAGDFVYEWAGVDDAGASRSDIHAIFVISHHEELAKSGIVVYGGRPSIARLRASPGVFHPEAGSQDVTFSLQTYRDETLSAALTVMNQESRSVLRTLALPNLRSGVVSASWDGRADSGTLVAPGQYLLRVRIVDALLQEATAEVVTTLRY